MRFQTPFLVAVLLLAAGACARLTPHKIEIQQGNFVTQEMVAQLKPGMTREQVRFVLGTALVIDLFHADRWDYTFLRQRANSREVEQGRMSVYFQDNKLQRVEGDVVPAQGGARAAPQALQ